MNYLKPPIKKNKNIYFEISIIVIKNTNQTTDTHQIVMKLKIWMVMRICQMRLILVEKKLLSTK